MTSETTSSAMSEEATTVLVPKLRFPEFQGTEEWGNAILGDLSQVVRGGSPRPIDGFLTTAADGLNWLKIGDVDKEAKYVTHTAEKVRPEALSKTRVVNPGDLILSNSMSFGRPYILQIKTCIHDGWIAITDIAKKADRDFLYYLISAPSSQIYFVDNAAGSGVQNLNANIIKALPVCFPSPAEQERIADCLSSLVELIAVQVQKVEALKSHKKGLMQQLFPREGEPQPRLRFPEFQDAGEWEARHLSDLCHVKHGYAFESTFFSNEGKYILLTPGNFFEQGGYRDRGEQQKYFTGEIPRDYVLAKGDMLVAMTEQAAGLLGSPILVPGSDRFLHNQRLGLVLRKPGVVWVNEFFFHLFNTQYVRKVIHATASGAKVRHTSPTKIGDISVSVPVALLEQQRIASCLSSLDALITAETQKFEAFKAHKKGLMQQLFPSAEEVTL